MKRLIKSSTDQLKAYIIFWVSNKMPTDQYYERTPYKQFISRVHAYDEQDAEGVLRERYGDEVYEIQSIELEDGQDLWDPVEESTQLPNPKHYIKAAMDYTDRQKYTRNRQKYSVYSANADSPEKLLLQVSELHPYDNAEYAWAKKDAPNSFKIIRSGKILRSVQIPEWDEDKYEDGTEYFNEIVDRICIELSRENAKTSPRIDRS